MLSKMDYPIGITRVNHEEYNLVKKLGEFGNGRLSEYGLRSILEKFASSLNPQEREGYCPPNALYGDGGGELDG